MSEIDKAASKASNFNDEPQKSLDSIEGKGKKLAAETKRTAGILKRIGTMIAGFFRMFSRKE